jgi:hypothetical protein
MRVRIPYLKLSIEILYDLKIFLFKDLLHEVAAANIFTELLKAPHLSGPYKLSALESLQWIIAHDVITNFSSIEVVYGNIIDAVIR